MNILFRQVITKLAIFGFAAVSVAVTIQMTDVAAQAKKRI